MAVKTQVSTEIDLDRPGKQQGYLRVPYSHNLAGWAELQIPITVIANGSGPTLLAIGGTHGDEFEGPVALMKLARALQPEEVQGRVIIIPALNLPAVRAGTRLSPVDGMNMNRAFPGEYNGSVTSMIAHYMTHVLMPLADIVMDIHSGGRSMVFYPCATLHRVPDDAQYARMLAAARIWGTRYVFIYTDVAGEGLLPVQAERMGKLVVTTEMGGGGECNPGVLRVAERGIRNIMIQQGLLSGQIEVPPYEVTLVAASDPADYVAAPADGVYESLFEVGEEVRAGQMVGRVHPVERCDRPPEPVMARTTGILIGRRAIGVTSQGDVVATIARVVEG
ncbi:MAG: succinylglutamate desuccinylase/aspartoacylase family protein [Chloroflexi bacterium]|nr:succinylglutamate desuccinylase/aspartoacylase family protein [Chloroflexota bacterium]